MAGTPRTVQVAVAIAAVAVIAVAGVVVGANLANDDPSTVAAPPTTAKVRAPATTGRDTTTTVADEEIDDPADVAVWPVASTSQRFDDPAAAAHNFAVQLAGFPEGTVVGEFRGGDTRSGEVEVRPSERGPVTTVLLRQLGVDGSWWVVGAHTENIVLDDPSAGDTISSPLTVNGRALAFEGTVEVELRADGQLEPIGGTFVTGGGDELRPFSGELEFPEPEADGGVLMLLSRSAEDGSVMEATVIRVRFG